MGRVTAPSPIPEPAAGDIDTGIGITVHCVDGKLHDDRMTGRWQWRHTQGHHVTQMLVSEWQEGSVVDASPNVPGRVISLLEGHLHYRAPPSDGKRHQQWQ
jgi:hypothetical protein